jgi:hypothetical protein
VTKYVGALGVTFLVWGVIQFIAAVVFTLLYTGLGAVMGIAGSQGGDQSGLVMGGVMASVGGCLGCVIGVMAIPNVLAGIGIRGHRKWGRILGIVMGALALTSFPIGTAIGIFALVVLLDKEVGATFDAAAAEAG